MLALKLDNRAKLICFSMVESHKVANKKVLLVIEINRTFFKTIIKEILGKIVIIPNFGIRDSHLSNREVEVLVKISIIKIGVRVATLTPMVN